MQTGCRSHKQARRGYVQMRREVTRGIALCMLEGRVRVPEQSVVLTMYLPEQLHRHGLGVARAAAGILVGPHAVRVLGEPGRHRRAEA